jgi:hypothetical protein
MAFEISLRPPFSLPRLLRAHADEPEQGYHWVGQTHETSQGSAEPGTQGEDPQGKKGKKGHRPLSSIKSYEVDEVSRAFAPQLVRSPLDGWIARNHFCRVHLKSQMGRRPPVVFGRVKSCYPEEGHAENVQEFDLLFPNRNVEPDVIHLQAGMVNFRAPQPVESFCLRVRFLFLAEERAEFQNREGSFLAEGFQPEIRDDYLELMEMNEQNQSSHPWLYVIGSRWLTSVPDFRYDVILGRLREMLGWGKRIVNYHPGWLPKEVHSVNRALGLKYKLSKYYLTEPENPEDGANALKIEFGEMFNQGLMG